MVSTPQVPADSSPVRSFPYAEPFEHERLLPVIGRFDPIPPHVDAVLTACARMANAGDRDARNRLFLAVQPKLLQIARQIRLWMLPVTWERDDLDQEAFVIFTELVDAWSGETPFTGYLLGHFSWRLRGAVRRARLSERLPLARSESAMTVADDSWAAEELRIMVEEIAAHFVPIEAEILIGRVCEGEGFGSLAYRLGVSRKTIYRHWTASLIVLRQSLGGQRAPVNPSSMSRRLPAPAIRRSARNARFHNGR